MVNQALNLHLFTATRSLCGCMQSEFSRRLEKTEHESKWKLEQQLESLSDSSKSHLRQVSFFLPSLYLLIVKVTVGIVTC